jgi:hypothetical protein
MPEAFEERKEEDRKETKKKPIQKDDKKALAIKSKGPEAIKTIMEIRDIRETARKGREIIARREGRFIEPKEEVKDLKYVDVDIKSILEPPPKPPNLPSNKPQAPMQIQSKPPNQPPKLSSITKSIPEESEQDKRNKKVKFEEMMRKMKKFLK